MSSGRAAQEQAQGAVDSWYGLKKIFCESWLAQLTILFVFEGTLRSRTTPSEENQAVADLSLGISPR